MFPVFRCVSHSSDRRPDVYTMHACGVSLILMKCDCTGTVIIRSDYHGYPHVLCMQRPRSPQCAMCVPPTYPCPDEGPWFPLMMHACMHGNIFISECAPLIACQIMNDVCHPIMRCWAHPRNAPTDSERCEFVSPTILKRIYIYSVRYL